MDDILHKNFSNVFKKKIVFCFDLSYTEALF